MRELSDDVGYEHASGVTDGWGRCLARRKRSELVCSPDLTKPPNLGQLKLILEKSTALTISDESDALLLLRAKGDELQAPCAGVIL
jgi:hypothetical protein